MSDPRATPPSALSAKQIAGVLTLFAVALGVWLAWDSFSHHRASADAEFCAKNLAYYEEFCRSHPQSCSEGARKLARCE